MDYNFLENVPSSLTPIAQYQPDFQFLQSMQMKANQQYEQGLSEVKASYATIFNQPVTGEAITKRQQEYAKQAQDQMKDISATDLSNPKNVQAAENIMAPFHSDPFLLQNIAATSHNQAQLQQLDSWKNSSDPDVRNTWDPDAVEFINKGIKKLAEAPLTKEAYSQLEKRQAVPFANIDADVDAEYTKSKEKGVDYSYTNGPVVYVNHNGPGSREAFKTWYLSKVGNKYDAQLRVKATVEMERYMDDIKRQNPGIDEKTVYNKYADEIDSRLQKSYSGVIKGYDDSAKQMASKLNDIIGNKDGETVLTPEQEKNATYYATQVKLNEKERDSYKNAYESKMGSGNPQSPAYQKYKMLLAEHPQEYLTQVYKDQIADRWAVGKASMSSVEIKANEGWNNLEQAELRKRDQAISVWKTEKSTQLGYDKMDEKEWEFRQKYHIPDDSVDSAFDAHKGFTGSGTSGVGVGSKIATEDIGTGRIGRDVTNAYHVQNKLDVRQATQNELLNNINHTVFNVEGISGLLSKDIVGEDGLSGTEIVVFTEGQKNALQGSSMTPEQAAISTKVRGLMAKYGGDNYGTEGGVPIGPEVMKTRLIEVLPKIVTNLVNSGNPDNLEKARKIQVDYQNIKKQRDVYIANEDKYNKAVEKFVANEVTNKKDSPYKQILNEKGRIYTTDQMAKDFPSIAVKVNGEEVTIDPHTFAEMWQDGSIRDVLKHNTILAVNGKKLSDLNHFFPIQNKEEMQNELNKYLYGSYTNTHWGFDGQKSETLGRESQWKEPDRNSIYYKYKEPGTLGKLKKQAEEKVISAMGEVGRDGLIGSTATYNITDSEKDSQSLTGATIVTEAIQPENREKVYTRNSTDGKQTLLESRQEVKDITELLTSDPKTLAKYVKSSTYHDIGPNGKPSVEINFNTSAGKSEGEKGSTKVSDILKKGSIWVDVSSNASGKLLQTFPRKHDIFVYGQMLTKGESIKSDPALNTFGFTYTITPQNKSENGDYSQVYIEIKHHKLDKSGNIIRQDNKPDGEPLWDTETKVLNLMQGSGALNPDEIMRGLDEYGRTWFHNRVTSSKMTANTPSQPGQQGRTINQFLQSINQ